MRHAHRTFLELASFGLFVALTCGCGDDDAGGGDTGTSPEDTSTSTSPEDTSTSTSPEDTSTSTSPADTSTSPEDTSTSTSPEDTSTGTSPEDTSTSTSPEDTSTSTSPEDTSTGTSPEDTSTSTSPEDTSTSTSPEDTSTSTSPEDTSTGTSPEDTSTSPEDTSTSTSPEDTSTSTSPEDTSTSTSPEDTSTSTSPEDTSTTDAGPSPEEGAAIDATCTAVAAFTLPATSARAAAIVPTIADLSATLVTARGHLTYDWSVGGVAVDYDTSVPSGVTQAGETWSLTITAVFAQPILCDRTRSTLVVEHPPACDAAVIGPAAPTTLTALTCACDGYSDLEGDPASSPTCVWSTAAEPALHDDCSLPAGTAPGGTELTCTLTPMNLYSAGDPVSAAVTLGNAAPTAPSAVTLTTAADPLDVTATAELVCEATPGSDPDGQVVTTEIAWLVGATTALTVDGPTDSQTLATLGAALGRDLERGDKIGCRARSTDGVATSSWKASATRTVVNAAPVIEAVALADTHLGADFECEVSGTDPDADVLELGFVWTEHLTDGSTRTLDADDSTLGPTRVARTSSVTCTAVLSDGATYTTLESEPAVIVNRGPTIGTLTLTTTGGATSTTTYRGSNLTCKASAITDPDSGDTIASVTYTWTQDATVLETETLSTGATSSLTAPPFTVGAVVSCSAYATDANLVGVTPVAGDATSKSLTVANAVPVCKEADWNINGEAFNNTETAICSCTKEEDFDDDVTGYQCTWTTYGGTTLTSWGTGCSRSMADVPAGYVWYCAVVPVDAYDPGTHLDDAKILGSVSPHSAPSWPTTNVTITPTSVTIDPDNVMTCNWDTPATDAQDSGFEYLVSWRYTGPGGSTRYSLFKEEYKSVPLGQLTTNAASPLAPKVGGTVYCQVKAFDGVSESVVHTSPTITLVDEPATLVTLTDDQDGVVAYGETWTCAVEVDNLEGVVDLRIIHENFAGQTLATFEANDVLSHSVTWTVPVTSDDRYVRTRCRVDIDEGDGAGWKVLTRGELHVVGWDEPEIVFLGVVPDDATSPCATKYCSVAVADGDALQGAIPMMMTVRWLVDGVEVRSSTFEVEIENPNGDPNYISAAGIPVHDGAELSCAASVWKSPALYTEELVAEPMTIVGDGPAIASASVSLPARAGDVVTCRPGEVTLNCATSVGYAYAWYVDGERLDDETGATFDTSDLIGGELVHCEVTPTTTGGAGASTAAAPVTIEANRWLITGARDESLAGVSAAVLGDLDGDGLLELALGAPGADPDGLDKAGLVYVVRGTTASPTTDLADLEDPDAGLGWALRGSTGGWDKYETCLPDALGVFYSCANGSPLSLDGGFLGPRGDTLGVAVARIGDVDEDGVEDLIVSAPNAYAHDDFVAGRVYLLSSAALAATPMGTLEDVAAVASLQIDGERGIDAARFAGQDHAWNGHLAGYAIAGGDFDGDGAHDIALGSPNRDPAREDSETDDNGRVTVVTDLQSWDVLWLGDESIDDHVYWYDGPGNIAPGFLVRFGSHLQTVGDLDGDGSDDLLAAPDDGQVYNARWVLLGGDGDDHDLAESHDSVLATADADWELAFVPGAYAIDTVAVGRLYFYNQASAAGDVNADGYADVVVPSFEREGGATQVEVAVIFGGPDLDDLDPAAADDGSGGFVIEGRPAEGSVISGVVSYPLGDIDGDGLDDVAFTLAPAHDPYEESDPVARLYVVFGKADGATITLAELEAGVGGFAEDFPVWIDAVSAADIDGDGLSDYVVSMGGRYDAAWDHGRVDVRFGRDYQAGATGLVRGTKDGDALPGTAGADVIAGGRGDDRLDGMGGADSLAGGSGDDELVVDAALVRADGGPGEDALVPLSDLDLTALRDKVRDVEVIDLGEATASVTISASVVRRISPRTNTLVVLGDGEDALDMTAGAWLHDGTATRDGVGYDVYVPVDDRAVPPTQVWVLPTTGTRIAPTLLTTTLHVPEDAADGTVLGALGSLDPDGGQVVALDVVSGDPFGMFALDPADASLTLVDASLIDHEDRATWTLTVAMTDDDGLTSFGEVIVAIDDVNEAPALEAQATTIEEGPADGTIVARMVAADVDIGDALTYTILEGNDLDAFAIDAATGIVTIADGTALDFEADPEHTLSIAVTDLAGLRDIATLAVTLTDETDFTKTITLRFFTTDQSSLSPTMANLDLDFDESYTDDFDKSLDLSLPGGWADLNVVTTGQFEMTYAGSLSTGEINAWVPIALDIGFPDQVRLGTPFTLDLGWELSDSALLWGDSVSLEALFYLHMQDVQADFAFSSSLVGVDDASTRFGGLSATRTIEIDMPQTQLYGVRASTIFPDGYDADDAGATCGTFSEELEALNTSCAWRWAYIGAAISGITVHEGKEDFLATFEEFGGDVADLGTTMWSWVQGDASGDDVKKAWITTGETSVDWSQESGGQRYWRDRVLHHYGLDIDDLDDTIVSSFVTSKVIALPLSPDDIMKDLFGIGFDVGTGGILWWASYRYDLGATGFFDLYYALWSTSLDIQVKMKQAYMLQVKDVTATFTFENGTTLEGVSLAEPLSVTLPAGEDADGDGRVTFTAVAEVEQRFLSIIYLVPGIHYYGDLLELEVRGYRRDYNTSGTQTGTTQFAREGYGPVQTTSYSFPLAVWDLTEAWSLPGFNTVTLTGAIQVAR